jgi:formamidopyrimidine-DNA glycosylase
MPELPEVQTVLRGLWENLSDRTVIAQDVPTHRMVKTAVPADLTPFRVTDAVRFGKFIRLDTDRGWRIVLHLGMSGKITVSAPLSQLPKHLRLHWTLDDGRHVYFIDPRGFGRIAFHPAGIPIPEEEAMGVEPLSGAFTPNRLLTLLHKRSTAVKTLLLDQHLVAGLGNIYVCEALHRAGIHPELPGKDLSPTSAKRLVREIKAVLKAAIAANGTSISDFRRIDDKTGEFQNFLQVYGKTTCACGATIERIVQGGRSSWFCPKCQKR